MSRSTVQQAKSLLAKLLAMEDLTVIHNAEAETASFNPKTRDLTLPILKDMEGFHYDGFIGHEIAHALFTPYDEKQMEKIHKELPHAFVNITEDARIERLVQNKYPGLRKDFYHLYEDFAKPEKNMFGTKDQNLNELPTIDKINLFFKIGQFENIPLNNDEKKLAREVEEAITFEEAVEAARKIYKYMQDTNQPVPPPGPPKEGEGEGDGKQGKKGGKPVAGFTQSEFEKNRNKQLVDSNAKNNQKKFGEALTSADVDRETVVNKKVFEKIKRNPKQHEDYHTFMNTVRPVVNMMVNQFNMKKAAADYKKTKIAKTGKLNMREIANYMTSEDIFLRNEIVHDEKNHGFVFFIDWSGSMQGTILPTYKQLLVLMHFCRKLQIPFEVYGFTNGACAVKRDKISSKKLVSNSVTSNSIFLMLESAMRKGEFEKAAETIFADIQNVHSMGDTPLNNTAMMSDIIMEAFKKKYGREKNILVLLSDGGAGDSIGGSYHGGGAILHNPQLSKNYDIKSYHDVFKYVKDRQEVTKMIGFYITDRVEQHVMDTIYPNRNGNIKDYQNDFKTKRWTCFDRGVAFDKFFAVDVSHFNINNGKEKVAFDRLDKYATEEKIAKAFEAMVSSMRKNMLFLNVMINEIS